MRSSSISDAQGRLSQTSRLFITDLGDQRADMAQGIKVAETAVNRCLCARLARANAEDWAAG